MNGLQIHQLLPVCQNPVFPFSLEGGTVLEIENAASMEATLIVDVSFVHHDSILIRDRDRSLKRSLKVGSRVRAAVGGQVNAVAVTNVIQKLARKLAIVGLVVPVHCANSVQHSIRKLAVVVLGRNGRRNVSHDVDEGLRILALGNHFVDLLLVVDPEKQLADLLPIDVVELSLDVWNVHHRAQQILVVVADAQRNGIGIQLRGWLPKELKSVRGGVACVHFLHRKVLGHISLVEEVAKVVNANSIGNELSPIHFAFVENAVAVRIKQQSLPMHHIVLEHPKVHGITVQVVDFKVPILLALIEVSFVQQRLALVTELSIPMNLPVLEAPCIGVSVVEEQTPLTVINAIVETALVAQLSRGVVLFSLSVRDVEEVILRRLRHRECGRIDLGWHGGD